ncbi:hypothetical protein NDU88_006783 [Pleurodeles waltl]|uniref:Uncharacterized protein n=1 Tax=Pleurodeles waltl TaxID=8319 RepID=A0AAV7SQL4_PLEWA|nr:hypothetical protein NDU88_006783 [Pleurodeles waltl]
MAPVTGTARETGKKASRFETRDPGHDLRGRGLKGSCLHAKRVVYLLQFALPGFSAFFNAIEVKEQACFTVTSKAERSLVLCKEQARY